jgi:hypothetical protein
VFGEQRTLLGEELAMSIWGILLIVLIVLALSGTGYGYTYGPGGAPAPYVAPLGGLAGLLLVVLILLWFTGALVVVPGP